VPYVKVDIMRTNPAGVPLAPLRRAIEATGYDPSMLEFDPR
jgi:hypothetical protein